MSQTVSVCLQKGIHFLESAGVPEAEISASELLSDVLRQPRLSLYLEPEAIVDRLRESEFENLLAKRASRYPLQYLVREVSFRSTLLEVGEGCLIPRPETEVLVDVILNRFSHRPENVHVLDIGTGSGNIAISLAQERPKWFITATDISEEALRYAEANADRNQVASRIRFVQTDLWQGIEGTFFDALVSNPPYLTASELTNLQPEVAFEPKMALDGGKDGLYFFKQIIQNAQRILKRGGFVFFETGMRQAGTVADRLEAAGFESIQISNDHSSIERIVSAQLK